MMAAMMKFSLTITDFQLDLIKFTSCARIEKHDRKRYKHLAADKLRSIFISYLATLSNEKSRTSF